MPLYLEFYFWILLISLGVGVLERLFPRSPTQEILRPGFVEDLFWMAFNTQYVSWMLAVATVHTLAWFNQALFHVGLPDPSSMKLISTWPLWLQFVTFFLIKDFLEWNIHHVLHRVPWLWEFHKLHHSARHLDWAAAFRGHWVEIVIYKVLIYLPLVILGVDESVIFWIVVVSLLMAELSHANLKGDWGFLRYILNTPQFHAWHHDVEMHGKGGQNFGTSLAIWDWVFGTAHFPDTKRLPKELGFDEMKDYPEGIWGRLWQPFTRTRKRRGPPSA